MFSFQLSLISVVMVTFMAPNATIVAYEILFGGMHPVVFISMMFHVSVMAPNATNVADGILFGGMHPVVFISMMCM